MPISKRDVEKVAQLARLELGEEELDTLANDLTDIVGYVETLEKIDTSGVNPQTQFIATENVFREDEPRASLPREQALKNAPRKTEEFFLVPKVLG
ncbi:Asp-tRNA(Asn)/Glu-tRNA(Gln) amidotransferase subunit GatC [Gemmatimonas aurantiaca]|nr:Asp-tRNA(Asn)/Glu-tRNA(Gln) amidotransferase subunit GatC [Gemmatimonas aurantiaca]